MLLGTIVIRKLFFDKDFVCDSEKLVSLTVLKINLTWQNHFLFEDFSIASECRVFFKLIKTNGHKAAVPLHSPILN